MSKNSQTKIIAGREAEMTHSSAGGAVFTVDDWTQMERFLVLGTEAGTYYVKSGELTKQNAIATLKCLKQDHKRAIQMIVDVSEQNRSYKPNSTLFALALATAIDDLSTRKLAFEVLPRVARTATHLFTFVSYMQSFRGWGKAARRAIANWYLDKDIKALAYQMIKYQQRNGWTHRDLLRLAHPSTESAEKEALFRYAISGPDSLSDVERKIGRGKDQPLLIKQRRDLTGFLPTQVEAFEKIKSLDPTNVVDAATLIQEHKLPREAVPTHFLTDKAIWAALLTDMPMTAMIRNLATMTRIGLLDDPLHEAKVIDSITDETILKRSRIHPIQMLIALKTYSQGKGMKGTNVWTVNSKISDALDQGFYKAFKNVTPTNKPTLLALDVSGSMSWAASGVEGLSAMEATAALSMVTLAVEPNAMVVGFMDKIKELDVKKHNKLSGVMRSISNLPFGATDCAAPFLWAKERKLSFENFAVYTDSETGSGSYWGYRGSETPSVALQKYRDQMGIPAKLVVVATEANNFTIADPKDAGMLDVCGFDGSVPQMINDFFAK
jgi:60 kDa SS-A/Ro ribonucleoprotein